MTGTRNGTLTQGWFRVPNEIIDAHGPALGPFGIAVYCCLAHHADAGGLCWPSFNTIARE